MGELPAVTGICPRPLFVDCRRGTVLTLRVSSDFGGKRRGVGGVLVITSSNSRSFRPMLCARSLSTQLGFEPV